MERIEGIDLSIVIIILYVAYLKLTTYFPVPETYNVSRVYNDVLNAIPRHLLAFLAAFSVGTLVNNYLLSKLKTHFRGKHLPLCFISSTAVGEAALQITGTTIAWAGSLQFTTEILPFMLFSYLYKIGFEIIMTPVNVVICNWLKQQEGVEIKATYKVIDTLNEERPYYEARDEKLGIFLCCYAIACILILIATLLLLNTFFTSTLLSTLLKSIPTTNPILRNCILIAFVIIIKTGLKIAIFALLMCTYMPLHKILIKDPFDNLPDNKNPSDTPNNHNLSEPQNKLHTLETACPPILKAIKNFPEKLPRDNWQNLSNIEKKEILNTLLKEKITRYPTTEENLLLYTTTYMLLYFILEASDRQSTPDKKLIAQVLSELNKSGNTLIKEANALRKYRVNNTETNTARTADTILEKFELLVVQLQILQQENTENKAAIGMSIDNAYSVIDQLQSEHADYKYADNVITFITYFCQFSFLIFTIANFSPLSIATSLLLGCVTGILSLCISLMRLLL